MLGGAAEASCKLNKDNALDENLHQYIHLFIHVEKFL